MDHILNIWLGDDLRSLGQNVSQAIDSTLAQAPGGTPRVKHLFLSSTPELVVTDRPGGEGLDDRELKALLTDAFTSMVRLQRGTPTNPVMHVNIMTTLYAPDEYKRLVHDIYRLLGEMPEDTSLDIIGFSCDLQPVISPHMTLSEKDEMLLHVEQNAAVIRYTTQMTPLMGMHLFMVISNRTAEGHAVGFTTDTLTAFMTALLSCEIADYDTILGVDTSTLPPECVMGLGMSLLRLDQKAFVRYLSRRLFLRALASRGIDTNEVDMATAIVKSQEYLKGCDTFYKTFWDRDVEPLLATGMAPEKVAAQVQPALQQRVRDLEQRLTAFASDPEMSLPMRQAVLGVMLGRDDDRLTGYAYDKEQLEYEDAVQGPLEELLRQYNTVVSRAEGADTAYLLDPDGNPVASPLPQLKSVRADILALSSYIRAKEDELQQLEAQSQAQAAAGRVLTQDGSIIDAKGERYVVMHEVSEKPLAEKYNPPTTLTPPARADLRPYLGPVGAQGAVPCCSAFAVAACYDVIRGRLAKERQPDAPAPEAISPRYMYYYSNVDEGENGTGSSLYEQLEVLTQKGSCLEHMCPYSVEKIEQLPSGEAEVNAMSHRVLRSMQIPLVTDGNLYTRTRANHRLLTSALAEGYAVAVGLRVFDSLQTQTWVTRPSDKAIANDTPEYHAMTLVGYDEDACSYIVRNSWGPQWGDDGYGYISFAYIDDSELCKYACIIADTTEPKVEKSDKDKDKGPAKAPYVAPLPQTDTEIRRVVVLNSLDEARMHLSDLQEQYKTLRARLDVITEKCSRPDWRKWLVEAAQRSLASEIRDKQAGNKKRQEEHYPLIREYRNMLLHQIALVTGIAIVVNIVLWMALPLFDYEWVCWLVSALSIVVIGGMIGNYRLNVRRFTHRLDDEIEAVARRIQQLQHEQGLVQMKVHVAGMVLDALHKLHLSLQDTHTRLESYITNLRQWYQEELGAVDNPADTSSMTTEVPLVVNILDRGILDQYFADQADTLSQGIDLDGQFELYQVSDDALSELRQRLQQIADANLLAQLQTFGFYPYLTGAIQYPYLPEPDVPGLLRDLENLSQPLLQHTSNERPSKCVICWLPPQAEQKWANMLRPYFAATPARVQCPSRSFLAVIATVPLRCDEVTMFRLSKA